MRVVADDPLTQRECTKCHRVLPLEQFFRSAASPVGRRPDCKRCNQARSKVWARANPHKRIHYLRKYLYGITKEDYERVFKEQHGCCAICKINFAASGYKPYVDHNHATGKVRGILCRKCNFGIANLSESVTIIYAAITYLRKYK